MTTATGGASPITPTAGPPTRLALPAPPVEVPAAVELLVDLCGGPDWRRVTTWAHGPIVVGAMSEETDGEGKRHRVEQIKLVTSVCVRARHTDGRAIVALYVQPSELTPSGRVPGFAL